MADPQKPFLLTLFTNDPVLASNADTAGVDRIGLDLEIHNKDFRQSRISNWISDHIESDLLGVKNSLRKAKLFVRTNSPHPTLKEEIDRYIDVGAEVLMLPYFHHPDDAMRFVDYVDGRAEVSLLVETAASAARIERVLDIPGISDIHIGLNDLHLSLGMSSHFELLVSPFMEWLCGMLKDSGLHWGFGGIGRANDTDLPIPSDLVYAQYAYLGGRSALVSRVFTKSNSAPIDMNLEIGKARMVMDDLFQVDRRLLQDKRDQLRQLITRFNN